MKSRRISKVAVLGSGIMGSSIAALFAGCGYSVLLLDLAHESDDRNKLVKDALSKCLSTKPSNIYHQKFSDRIEIGNFEDDLKKINSADWIIEAIVEKAELKKALYEKLELFRRKGTIITTNTSGIPIHTLSEGRTDDFIQHFCGTHFFNPPRYLQLMEIIPTKFTSKDVVHFLEQFAFVHLGKQTVLCKDKPGFIANRIGVVTMSKIYELAFEFQLQISDVDKLTGPALGRPKSGTFRLGDLVGLDTANLVLQDLKMNCPDDLLLQKIGLTNFMKFLLENKWFGNKAGKGFYEKTNEKDSKGKPIVKSLDLHTLEYTVAQKVELESLRVSKQIEDLPRRLKAILKCQDNGAKLIQAHLAHLFQYSALRIPEISDHLYAVDQAMKSGYGWELGPFETWDAIGLESGLELITSIGESPAQWVLDMKSKGNDSFYKLIEGRIFFYDLSVGNYKELPQQDKSIVFNILEQNKLIYSNTELKLWDIGDGVLSAEFVSKYNAIGEGILRGLQEAVTIAEENEWKGLVIANNSNNFTVGANLMLIGMLAFQQEYEQLEMAVRLFQNTSMRLRYSTIPVVAATQGYVFGGGTEFLMHCDASVCSVESYIGLVEVGVGLLPGGGGTKEFALRFSEEIKEGEVMIPQLILKFKTLATGQIATSAFEAYDYDYLQTLRDDVSFHGKTHIYNAKQKVISLAEKYVMPVPKNNITVLGRSGLGTLYSAAHSLWRGGYASEHDVKIAKKIAHVLCGGDLSYPQKVTEQYLLDIEREAFLSLCSEPKTLERIQYMLENNKPLRN